MSGWRKERMMMENEGDGGNEKLKKVFLWGNGG